MADLNPRTLFAHLEDNATQTPLASLQHVVHAEERRLTRRLEVDLVLERLHDDPLREQARYVRDVLNEARPLARQWWQTRGENGPKQPEDVRAALLAVRSEHPDAVPMRERSGERRRVRVLHDGGRPRIEAWDDDGVEDMQHLLPEVLGLQRGHGLDRFREHLGVSTDETIVRQLVARRGADTANRDAPGAPR